MIEQRATIGTPWQWHGACRCVEGVRKTGVPAHFFQNNDSLLPGSGTSGDLSYRSAARRSELPKPNYYVDTCPSNGGRCRFQANALGSSGL
jgi:hypothetical protein